MCFGHKHIVCRNNEYGIDSLNLDQRLLNCLKKEGYTKYFPIQKYVIPAIIRGYHTKRDVAVCAPTGSGKTLAYILPICHILGMKYMHCKKKKCVTFFFEYQAYSNAMLGVKNVIEIEEPCYKNTKHIKKN